jgi:isopentenyl phosphate kinase
MIFLKLGGSLITDKARPETARPDVLARLAQELAEARAERPKLRLLLGHGSGSFGHVAAAKHGTHLGAHTEQEWRGFLEVWQAAHRLHGHVLEALRSAGLPAMSFPPSATAVCENGEIMSLAHEPILLALEASLLPVVLGDVAFDRHRGATILSTERVMGWLADALAPSRILLAGVEEGVYERFPLRDRPLERLSHPDLERLALGESTGTDVTGGMAAKVRWGLDMIRRRPDREIRIFSATAPGNLLRAIRGDAMGTLIYRRMELPPNRKDSQASK